MSTTTPQAPKPVTKRRMMAILKAHGGNLASGKHQYKEDCPVCVLECLALAMDMPMTDAPSTLRSFDLRPLNDMRVSGALRTKHMIPLAIAYAGSLDWPQVKKQAVVEALVRGTVNRIIAKLPDLTDAVRAQCREAKTMPECQKAAAAAAEAVAAAAEAEAAAEAVAVAAAVEAAAAAEAEAAAAAEAVAVAAVFVTTCDIWLKAAKANP